MSLVLAPWLGWPVIASCALAALLAAAWARQRGLRGWAWRGLAGLALAAALAGPGIETATRMKLGDIVVLLEDRSASQSLPGRTAQTDAAAEALAAAIAALPGTELRRVTLGDDPEGGGTRLGAALAKAVAAEPEGRLAGIIALTDGLLHDPAALPARLPAPLHVLLTGREGDWDRRLVLEQAPGFGQVGKPVALRLRVVDDGPVPPAIAARPARLTITTEAGPPQELLIPPGAAQQIEVTPTHAGPNALALAIDPAEGQLTDLNDRASVTITGLRDRLRVLLVSGEPHAGERTWRNLLRSDAAVDLIHFTILRPPDKADGVPVDEMALIAFPTRELFLERIDDFDLIIFDRYRERGILPPDYFESVRAYVERGGAILVAGGPEMAGVEGLTFTPLAPILPGTPTGRIVEAPFRPVLTDEGRRHPVTAGLPGAPPPGGAAAAQPAWGRWLRRIEVVPAPGAEVLMSAPDGAPLLLVSRAGEGRVALLASDQAWLWGRGFEGGGPQLELLRRIAHWSMQEPELEEEALNAQVVDGLRLRIERRSLKAAPGPVTVTAPDGSTADVPLAETAPGRFTADWTAPGPGLVRLTQGELTRLLALGPPAPREVETTVADGAALAPLAEASGGSLHRLAEGMPRLRTVAPGRPTAGQSATGPWIALTPRGAETETGRSRKPLLPGWAWLALVASLALAAWLTEGRRRA